MSNSIIFTQKQAKWKDIKDSKAMKQIMADPDLAGVLNHWDERKELHNLLSEKAQKGNITVKEMQEIVWKMRNEHGPIDKNEAMKIAQKLIPKCYAPYRIPKETKENKPLVTGKSLRQAQEQKNSPNISGSNSSAKSVREPLRLAA